MSGEMSGAAPRDLTPREKFDKWLVNEGSRRLFVFIFVVVHGMVFAFGFVTYQVKDNLTIARGTFGITYPIARAAALVLHVDIALILFRQFAFLVSPSLLLLKELAVCRTLISLMRQTPLNGIIQFGKSKYTMVVLREN